MRSAIDQVPGAAPRAAPGPVRHFVVEDVDQAGELLRRWDGIERRYVQVERGRFRNAFTVLELGDVSLLRSVADPGYAMTGAAPPGSLALFLVRARSSATRWCGRELPPGSLGLSRAGDEHAGRSFGPVDLLNVSVSCDALHAYSHAIGREDVAARLGVTPWPAASPARDGTLERQLAEILCSTAQHRGPLPEAACRELATTLIGVVVDAVARPNPVARVPAPVRRRRAVAKARDYLAASGPYGPTVPELCAAAGVSQRTLEYAFREQLGLRPAQFLKLRRLNAARAALLAATPATAAVTGIALELGFDYGALFGESPSQTLRRPAP